MLQGDSPQKVEKYLIGAEKKSMEASMYGGLSSQIIKIGHHGSRTSTASEYIETVSPDYAVISERKNNSYGFPHEETLDTLEKFNVKVFRTDEIGRIIFQSDGKNLVIR